MKKNSNRLYKTWFYSAFVFYVIMLFAILFRASYETRTIYLIPFHTIVSLLSRSIFSLFVFSNLFGNIILFMPLGIYLLLFTPNKSKKKSVFWVFLMSFVVEIVQYTFKLGIGDVDDIILNVLGGYLGIVIYQKLLLKLRNEKIINSMIGMMAFGVSMISLWALIFIF